MFATYRGQIGYQSQDIITGKRSIFANLASQIMEEVPPKRKYAESPPDSRAHTFSPITSETNFQEPPLFSRILGSWRMDFKNPPRFRGSGKRRLEIEDLSKDKGKCVWGRRLWVRIWGWCSPGPGSGAVWEKKQYFYEAGYIPVISQISQNKYHQRVYLVDGDDFCFWICEKYLLYFLKVTLNFGRPTFFCDPTFSNFLNLFTMCSQKY